MSSHQTLSDIHALAAFLKDIPRHTQPEKGIFGGAVSSVILEESETDYTGILVLCENGEVSAVLKECWHEPGNCNVYRSQENEEIFASMGRSELKAAILRMTGNIEASRGLAPPDPRQNGGRT